MVKTFLNIIGRTLISIIKPYKGSIKVSGNDKYILKVRFPSGDV